MAKRQVQRHRRLRPGTRDPIGGKCEAENCPHPAYAEVFIPDSGRKHRLCGPHAGAVERQIRRNEEAAQGSKLERAEERLGLR